MYSTLLIAQFRTFTILYLRILPPYLTTVLQSYYFEKLSRKLGIVTIISILMADFGKEMGECSCLPKTFVFSASALKAPHSTEIDKREL